MRSIDADAIQKDCDAAIEQVDKANGGKQSFEKIMFNAVKRYINDQDTVGPVKHDLIMNPNDLPKNEHTVLFKVRFFEGNDLWIIGFYEDGELNEEDSMYDWGEVSRYMEYDYKTQKRKVPAGWFERSIYSEGGELGCVNGTIVEWIELEELDE